MRSSVKPGQSQLLIPLLIVITSAVVFAANTTIGMINASMNGSDPTGAYLYISPQTQTESFMIEVWADTFVEVVVDEKNVKVRLLLDDGSPISGQEISASVKEKLVSILITDDGGYVEFIIPNIKNSDVKIVFSGNSEMFLNPSEIHLKSGVKVSEIDEQSKTSGDEIIFGRGLDCHKCGKHKTPPLVSVNMTIEAGTTSEIENGDLIDYYPNEWIVEDSNGGYIDVYNSTYNKIEWDVGNITEVSRWYVIKSPQRALPPTNYYFFSELDGIKSDLWRVIISDPTTTYNLSDSNNNRAYGVSQDTANTVTTASTNSDNPPPAWSNGWGGFNFTSTGYNNVESDDSQDAFASANATDEEPYLRFNFTINENIADIYWIYVAIDGNKVGGAGEDCYPYIANFTGGAWYQFDSVVTNGTDVLSEWNITTGFSNYIDSNNQLVLLFYGNDHDNNTEGCEVDFVYVQVDYFEDLESPNFEYNNSNTSSTYTGEPVLIYANWSDNYDLDYAWLSTNETGVWTNYTDGTYGSPIDINLTGSETWSNFTWDNDTFISGVVAWRIYANDSSGNDNVTGEMTINVIEGLAPTYSNNSTNTTGAGKACNFTLDWNDTTALSGYIFSTNNSGTWVNDSFVSFSGTFNTSWNVTILNSTPGTIVGWCFYTNDTLGNMNGTGCTIGNYYILTTKEMKQFNLTVYNSTGGTSDSVITIYQGAQTIGSGIGNIETDVYYNENYTIEITRQISNLNLTVRIEDLNITENFNITSQILNYTANKPDYIENFTSVFALNDTNLNYNYVNITIPKNGSVTKIFHCLDWNFSSRECYFWERNYTSDYNFYDTGTYITFN
ncbi:MAG: hypothetical protein ACW96U_05800, partial [Candidatus Heimdallarchaeaceae archaeon]